MIIEPLLKFWIIRVLKEGRKISSDKKYEIGYVNKYWNAPFNLLARTTRLTYLHVLPV